MKRIEIFESHWSYPKLLHIDDRWWVVHAIEKWEVVDPRVVSIVESLRGAFKPAEKIDVALIPLIVELAK